MVFYEMYAKISFKNVKKAEKTEKGEQNFFNENGEIADIKSINECFGMECALDGRVSFIITEDKVEKGLNHTIKILAALMLEKESSVNCKKAIEEKIREAIPEIQSFKFTKMAECSVKHMNVLFHGARRRGICGCSSWDPYEMRTNFFECNYFSVREKCFDCFNKDCTYDEMIKKAREIMASDTLIEELGRIYSPDNAKKFYGNPVHYKLTVGSTDAAKAILEIMIPALLANGRLLGGRVSRIFDVDERCYNEDDLDNLFYNAQGTCVAIELKGNDGMHGNYASSYEQVVNEFDSYIKKYGMNSLCFFIEDVNHPGFSVNLMNRVSKYKDIIEIKEGSGDINKAVEFFKALSDKTDFPADEEEIRKFLPVKSAYTVTDVYGAYNKWHAGILTEKLYKTYQKCEYVKVEEKELTEAEPYTELQNMVGLENIKEVVDQIIAAGRMRRMKSRLGLNYYKESLHMIFTGNPGSAKTTVARLIAQILKKEEVLDTGNFVEVGRADLIARYVGWTAKTVREKFNQARGGILFIDEAYSLVDDNNSFGDEAINTIVQEMENHREDVIVIFAGYPKKMESFLQKNEGLRSRIAFHLNFPDYTPDEMWQILKLQADKKEMKLARDVKEKCIPIFETACSHAEFGNGRFARNLLEQAMMRQAQRVCQNYNGQEVSREEISSLTADDFVTNAVEQFKVKNERKIGF